MRLLIDANLSPRVAAGLSRTGFEASHVADLPAVAEALTTGALVSIARGRLRVRSLPVKPAG
jgi:predicted nuclease of predicted toxin-antitoxin system